MHCNNKFSGKYWATFGLNNSKDLGIPITRVRIMEGSVYIREHNTSEHNEKLNLRALPMRSRELTSQTEFVTKIYFRHKI